MGHFWPPVHVGRAIRLPDHPGSGIKVPNVADDQGGLEVPLLRKPQILGRQPCPRKSDGIVSTNDAKRGFAIRTTHVELYDTRAKLLPILSLRGWPGYFFKSVLLIACLSGRRRYAARGVGGFALQCR